MDTPASPDAWFAACTEWADTCTALRRVVRSTGLKETLKWRQPAYTDNGKNIALIGVLKDSAVLSFFRGALLTDPSGLLVSPGQASRHTRYLPLTSPAAVEQHQASIEAFLAEAVALTRAGKTVGRATVDAADYVAELQERIEQDPAFGAAFEALTPGRRRGYNLHFASAKRPATRVKRIERATERIFAGKGLQDCICGRSKRMPRCDGSHNKPA